MNEEQKKFLELPLNERENYYFKLFPDSKLLKKKLLNIGGDKVIWMLPDPHLSLVIENGQEFSLNKRKKVKGDQNHCHGNVAKLFLQKDINIATGYTLCAGRWIQHSWGYDGKKVIETTCLFDAYYGVILSGLEITKFIFGELRDEILKFPKEQIAKLPLPENIESMK